MINGDNESYYVERWIYKHRERLRYSWVLQRKTQQRVQKNGTSYERKSTPFSIDVGTKYSLEKSYAKDEQNKRYMGTRTSYHN